MGFAASGPSGFNNAPVSKALVLFTVTGTIFSSMMFGTRPEKSVFNYNGLTRFQLWRVFTAPFFFSSVGELLFGVLLIYIFRLFERQWGSHKYLIYCAWANISTLLLQLGVRLFIGPSVSLWPGQYAIVFAGMAQYLCDVPPTSKQRVAGIPVTEKVFVYIIGLQMALLHFPHSLIAASCGFFAGLLYKINFFRIRRLRFPKFLARLSAKYILPLFQSSPASRAVIVTAPHDFGPVEGQEYGQGRVDTLIGGAGNPMMNEPDFLLQQFIQTRQRQPAGQPGPTELSDDGSGSGFGERDMPMMVSEEHIQQIEAMGFDRETARQALERANDDVTVALNFLLGE